MVAATHPLRYLAETTDFDITYKQEDFELPAFSDVSWGSNPDIGKSTSSYIVMLLNVPVSLKVGLQGLTAQPKMKVHLGVAVLTEEAPVIFSNTMQGLEFCTPFDNVPVYTDSNTSALHVAAYLTYSLGVKRVTLRYFFSQKPAKEGIISIYYMKAEYTPADVGTRHLTKLRIK